MTPPLPPAGAPFDQYSAGYDAALEAGLAVSGEGKTYFARGRVTWLQRRLAQAGLAADRVLDFGCGTGSAAPFLLELLAPRALVGVDISTPSLEIARREHGSSRTRFLTPSELLAEAPFDVAYCNGVFHHIPLGQRDGAVACVWGALRPGGTFAFWENNPWNPGTRYVMSRIPFDHDALTLRPAVARALLRRGGFEVVRTDFLFVFPRTMAWFRGLETLLARWPLGAQYLVLVRKPRAPSPAPNA